jgi:hypothetical protein
MVPVTFNELICLPTYLLTYIVKILYRYRSISVLFSKISYRSRFGFENQYRPSSSSHSSAPTASSFDQCVCVCVCWLFNDAVTTGRLASVGHSLGPYRRTDAGSQRSAFLGGHASNTNRGRRTLSAKAAFTRANMFVEHVCA